MFLWEFGSMWKEKKIDEHIFFCWLTEDLPRKTSGGTYRDGGT